MDRLLTGTKKKQISNYKKSNNSEKKKMKKDRN